MTAAITPPFMVAALVLCAAGAAKLRSPAIAVAALSAAGLPAARGVVRGFACCELALGVLCVVRPAPATAGALAGSYVLFTGLGVVLARRRASCGCFGASEAPASVVQAVLSGVLAIVAVVAAVAGANGIDWILGSASGSGAVLILGTAGAAYGTVLAYTELPQALTAWSSR